MDPIAQSQEDCNHYFARVSIIQTRMETVQQKSQKKWNGHEILVLKIV